MARAATRQKDVSLLTEEGEMAQVDTKEVFDSLLGRFDSRRPGLLEASETDEERQQRIRQSHQRDLVALAEVAVRVPEVLPWDIAVQIAEKLGDENLKHLVYLHMLHHVLSSFSTVSISLNAAFKVVEKNLKEQGILGEDESLRDLAPKLTLDSVLEALSKRIGRLE